MTVDPKRGNELLAKLFAMKNLPCAPDPAPDPVPAPKIPPGLESDPIALQLRKMGMRVTRAAWLTLDRGSSDESNLDPETLAMLDRMFPADE